MNSAAGRFRPILPASSPKVSARNYLACLRLKEILILQAPPLLGAAFALRHATATRPAPLALLLIGNLCLVAHIFVLNDWSNVTHDLADPRKAGDVFTVRGISRAKMGWLAGALLVGSLVLFGELGWAPLAFASGVATVSALYSLPRFDWKGRPLLGSVAHLVGGVLHFLLGYSLGGPVAASGFVAALFFAVTFTAGHLTQEVRDHEGDLRNGVRTNAVVFGPRRAFAASMALFTVSQALLLYLALRGQIHPSLAWLCLLHGVHLRWSFQALSGGLAHESICRLQRRYRSLYAITGLAMVVTLCFG